ncbi:NAD(P)/FAD-dependent oxidoreductase [Pseudomonas corrugata]|uniref:NAD(P)/FAD-dependent oxidoreductase n=1 Tax=Pseudomonas corrugata TaxID=47879 RepID=UPI001585FD1C|nr:FAD-dependent oxidoreductase [Pseudomonas corrugata]MCI0995638.1 FAD-dependent oxidoreductase [Pseudomonas corrugata]NUT64689.1 FAD-dependent oxidoreductase [Pseudomonas corrugata]
MSLHAPIVIIGAGQAGFQAASSLREAGHQGSIALVGDEPHLPYSRPPLSKAYLAGKTSESQLVLRSEAFYREQRIDLHLGCRVLAVDRKTRLVTLDDGNRLSYENLIFATGARNRTLPVDGAESLEGVYALRTLDDAKNLRQALSDARHAVVIGAGFVGLEFAATSVQLGVETTVIELQPRPLARAVSASMAEIFTRQHRSKGISFRFGAAVRRVLRHNGRVSGIELDDGEQLNADLLLVGIGAQANSELAASCGLEVAQGIVVDRHLQTLDPHIWAIGDCAQHPNVHADSLAVRLESIQNAADQARCVAAQLCGHHAEYVSLPWFWSDQGDLKLQIAGLLDGHDQLVVRGTPDSVSCSVFCFKAGRLIAVESVNRPVDHIAARRLLSARVAITPEQASDLTLDLRQLATSYIA